MRKIFVFIMVVMAFCFFSLSIVCALEDDGGNRFEIMEFRLAHESVCPNCREMIIEGRDEKLFVESVTRLSLADVVSARYHPYKPSKTEKEKYPNMVTDYLLIDFDDAGAAKLADLTSQNIDKRLGVIVEGKLIMAPIIKEPIVNQRSFQLAGAGLTEKNIKQLAARINKLTKNR